MRAALAVLAGPGDTGKTFMVALPDTGERCVSTGLFENANGKDRTP